MVVRICYYTRNNTCLDKYAKPKKHQQNNILKYATVNATEISEPVTKKNHYINTHTKTGLCQNFIG